ncbi:MAG: hypothetical protein OXF23_03210 [Candidatus Dadabacteria bacterium]|nr:hypothetical protein [Candidatus Dadabacteria bacterium]MCY4262062.1 hypothetical protein [Candidatus Dadabacteria bacterium]
MVNKTKTPNSYLETLEKVKEQYQQYLEVSKIYELPTFEEERPTEYEPPSQEHPLTTNTLRAR